MEEKKVTKISLSTFFLILSLIVIIVMGIFMYKFYSEKTEATKKSAELQTQVNSLNEKVSNLQGKINSISETSNTTTNNAEENEKLYDDNKKISIICPKEWKFVYPDVDGGELHIETIDSTINKYVGINIASHENWNNETLYEHLNSLADGYDNYNEIQIKGTNAIIYNNKSQIQYGECTAAAFFIKDGYIYEISYYSNNENLFDEHYKTFEGILSTVELY